MLSIVSQISVCDSGLALRLTKPMAKEAGVVEGTPVSITVMPGRIVIDAKTEPTLEEMLAAFNPEKHGGEFMVDLPVGAEVLD
jgi:antitoxin MazE